MHFFDRKLSLLILIVTTPLLFLPKLNLISVHEKETAGIRLDDFMLAAFSTLLLLAHAYSGKYLDRIEKRVLSITVFGIFSWLLNRFFVSLGVLQVEANLLYAVRILEYFMFFYIGAMAASLGYARGIVSVFLAWNLGLMLLQKMNFLGGMIAEGYRADVSDRVQGVASFPSEMGLILNLLFCYFLYGSSASTLFKRIPDVNARYLAKRLFPYALFCLFGIFVVLTGNRISILALAVCFIPRILEDLKRTSRGAILLTTAILPIVIAVIGVIIWQTAGVWERSIDLLSTKNLELVEIVWDKTDISSEDPAKTVISSHNFDVSWWIRIHKWIFALKLFLTHPECLLQGLGPGSCGAALDGGVLRLLVENGLIGAILYGRFFSSLRRLNPQAKWMMAAFALNMIFFDASLSYKAMSLLLFMCGSFFEEKALASKKNQPGNLPSAAQMDPVHLTC
jgi:uncharacterized protein with PQ loop repeat